MKNLITVGLLIFVAASIGVAIMKQKSDSAALSSGGEAVVKQEEEVSDGLIAYYFHTSVRCETCASLEAYSLESLKTGFAEQMAEGQIHWRVVNYELPENKAFQETYELVMNSLVLVEMNDGEAGRSENLIRIWELVGDKEAFVDYVQQGVSEFLAAGESEVVAK